MINPGSGISDCGSAPAGAVSRTSVNGVAGCAEHFTRMAGILRALHKALHESGCVAPGTAASLDHKNSFHSSVPSFVLCFNVPFSVFSFSQYSCPQADKRGLVRKCQKNRKPEQHCTGRPFRLERQIDELYLSGIALFAGIIAHLDHLVPGACERFLVVVCHFRDRGAVRPVKLLRIRIQNIGSRVF